MRKLQLILFLFLIFGCVGKKCPPDPKVLIDADTEFSDFSLKNGFHKAFITYAADSVTILKPGHLPLVGKNNLIKSYEGRSDSGLVLTWKPIRAVLSESGDLGFTYGIWTLIAKKDTSQGTYLTVWAKDVDGRWKFIADTGNDGLGKK